MPTSLQKPGPKRMMLVIKYPRNSQNILEMHSIKTCSCQKRLRFPTDLDITVGSEVSYKGLVRLSFPVINNLNAPGLRSCMGSLWENWSSPRGSAKFAKRFCWKSLQPQIKSGKARPDNHIKGTSRIAESMNFLLCFGKATKLYQGGAR